MAKRYRPVDRDQPFLFPPDMREWLPPDHPVHLVIAAVGDHLDTSAFHAGRRTGGAGAAGYDPDMLAAVLAGPDSMLGGYDPETLLPAISCPVLLLQACPVERSGARADRSTLEKTISSLGNRLFLLHNIHRGG